MSRKQAYHVVGDSAIDIFPVQVQCAKHQPSPERNPEIELPRRQRFIS